MASALASPPPLFSGGSADLKANARKFLERALVISALVHLAAVGVFRAADERSRSQWERDHPLVPAWERRVDFGPHIVPIDWNHRLPSPVSSDQGVFEPRAEEVPFPTINPGAGRVESPGVTADPHDTGGNDVSRGAGPAPPLEPTRPFVPVDTPPVPIVMPRPAYPTWAREAGIEGKVLVRVLVGTDGVPRKAVIIAGPKGLTEGVVDAVLRWRFKPGLANRVPVEVWVEIPITFRLGE